jgi:hypothetical protein
MDTRILEKVELRKMGKPTSQKNVGKVLGLSYAGYSQRQIGHKLHMPRSTINSCRGPRRRQRKNGRKNSDPRNRKMSDLNGTQSFHRIFEILILLLLPLCSVGFLGCNLVLSTGE